MVDHPQQNIIKNRHPAICNNVDDPGGHCAKGNEPGIERPMSHDLTYYIESERQEAHEKVKSSYSGHRME